MRKHQNLIVAAFISALIGALMGAGVIQYAQVLAYFGNDPEAARHVPFTKQVDYYRNSRSIVKGTLEGTDILRTTPKEATDTAGSRHETAPVSDAPDYCAGTTHQRRTQCLLKHLEGIIFHLRENE